MQLLRFGFAFLVGISWISGTSASAQSGCYSYEMNACPYNISNQFSVVSFFSQHLGYPAVNASIQQDEPAKITCVRTCQAEYVTSEQACLATPPLQLKLEQKRAACKGFVWSRRYLRSGNAFGRIATLIIDPSQLPPWKLLTRFFSAVRHKKPAGSPRAGFLLRPMNVDVKGRLPLGQFTL